MKSRFGLHIRLKDSLFEAVEKTDRLGKTFFQTVLLLQSKKQLEITDDQIHQFVAMRSIKYSHFIVHAAYWSNITDVTSRGFYTLQREIALAEKLGATHMVIHPGSFSSALEPFDRIDRIVQAVQLLLKQSSKLIFLLENSPHQNRSFSASIEEFGLLFTTLSVSDRVQMCIDTAHAHVAGYDLSTVQGVHDFIDLIIMHVGADKIGLLHVNDTKKPCGSFIDEHAIPGYGNIGMESLYRFVHHPALAHVPVIFEMPALDESLELDIIQQFEHMDLIS